MSIKQNRSSHSHTSFINFSVQLCYAEVKIIYTNMVEESKQAFINSDPFNGINAAAEVQYRVMLNIYKTWLYEQAGNIQFSLMYFTLQCNARIYYGAKLLIAKLCTSVCMRYKNALKKVLKTFFGKVVKIPMNRFDNVMKAF